jgi:hypothetical protein
MIIILFPYKFTNFFYKKYQINDLKKTFKNKIEIHDMSKIISKKLHNVFDNKRNKSAIVFDQLFEWKNHIQKLLKKEKKIYVINLISSESVKSFFIHLLLHKQKLKIVKLISPEIYEPVKSNSLYLKIVSFFDLLLFNLPRLFFVIKNILFNKLLFFLKFDELYILVSGSNKFALPLNIRSKKKQIIKFHASDFANYLVNKKKRIIKKNLIVFLDTKTPAFIGDRQIFKYKINYDIKKWYKELNIFLDKVEKKFNSKVVIIPHPMVREKNNIYYDKKFRIAKNSDASNELISKCKYVLSISATTAVSYCVIYNKPLTFIYNNQMIKYNPSMYYEIKELSNILSSGMINMNEDFQENKIKLSVDKKRYLNYRYNFLTSKNISQKKNSEVLKKLFY